MADKDIQADKPEIPVEPEPSVEDSPSSDTGSTSKQAELPEDRSEQGKAFAAMRKEIADLKAQVQTRDNLAPPQTQNINPQTASTPQQTPAYVDINQYIDSATGEFNAQSYNQAVNQLIDSQNQYYNQQLNLGIDFAQAQMAFPELDPYSEKYDPIFAQEVAQKHYYQTVGLGQQASIRQIAKEMQQQMNKDQKKEEAKIEAETQEVTAEKELASQETPGQSAQGVQQAQTRLDEAEEEAELVAKTRGLKGDSFTGKRYSEEQQLEATVERLKKVPWVRPQEEQETAGT